MGGDRRVEEGLLVTGILAAEGVSLHSVQARLMDSWGPVIAASVVAPFTQTTYYAREMGPGLRRQFLAFERRLDPALLAAVKREGIAIEAEWMDGANRRVNIDPGCLTRAKLILASTKDHAHRIPLGDGIHAEVTLVYHRGRGYEPWPWTYPDYREEWVRAWFTEARRHL